MTKATASWTATSSIRLTCRIMWQALPSKAPCPSLPTAMRSDPCRPAQNASKVRCPPSPQRTKDLHVFWQPQKRADGGFLKIIFIFNNLNKIR
ncbi:hypothetical protein RHECNPAF_1740087 [Rhizobium etli CNPAF512]|nr:hypothetical protein RHECNPAF_1740087 [Rhizobium etli CNPAF512]